MVQEKSPESPVDAAFKDLYEGKTLSLLLLFLFNNLYYAKN